MKWLTLVFVKSSYSLTYLRLTLDIYWLCYLHTMASLNFCVIFLLLRDCPNLHAVHGGSSLVWPKFTNIRPFLFTIYACPDNYADIWPRISQIYRYHTHWHFYFSSFILFQTSYEMTIKPINRTKDILSSAHSPYGIT